ncbi:MAG: M28 family peptidase [Steroidobacterales bacterium]
MLLAACTPARRGPPPSSDIDEDGYREQLTTLASEEFNGRRPGTSGETRTIAYLVAQFRLLKLKPVSGDSYLQAVPMVEFTPEKDPSLTISGRGPARTLTPVRDMVIWSRRDQAQAGVQGSELVFAGFGLAAPEYARDDYAGLDVHGKTVVVLAGEPARPAPGTTGPRGHMPGFYARAAYKINEAARHGASGVLLIHDGSTAANAWDVIVNDGTGPHLERALVDGNGSRPAFEGWLSADAGRALFADAGLDYAAALAAASGSGFRPIPLGLRADADIRQSVRHFTSSNVIGMLPGGQHHDEYVIYSAHWDHLGSKAMPAGAVVFPGAVDNASGVAGLLQLARSFTRTYPAPGRSIVFMALTGGESKLAGSGFYADNPVYPLQDTVADINLDTLRIGGPTRDITVFGFGQSELEGYLRTAATLQGRELHAEPDPQLGTYYRSDNFSFAARGVPALFAVGGADDAARGPQWGQAQIDDYYQHRYHRPGDAYSPDWDLRGTATDLRLYYRVGVMLAQGGRFPNWYHNSEFRIATGPERGN